MLHTTEKNPCLLIAGDTVLAKIRSKKIELVSYQYSSNRHDIIAGIGLLKFIMAWIISDIGAL